MTDHRSSRVKGPNVIGYCRWLCCRANEFRKVEKPSHCILHFIARLRLAWVVRTSESHRCRAVQPPRESSLSLDGLLDPALTPSGDGDGIWIETCGECEFFLAQEWTNAWGFFVDGFFLHVSELCKHVMGLSSL